MPSSEALEPNACATWRTVTSAESMALIDALIAKIAAVPVWIPGALFIVAFVRRAQIESPPPLRVAILVAGFPTFVFGPLLTMITHTSQYTYSFPGGSEGGDYFTPGRAAFAIVVIVADVVAATLIALPRSS